MLESILFIFLIFVGVIFLAISLITILTGFVKKSRKIKNIGLGLGVIPIICFGLITAYYLIILPSAHENQMEDFAGTYVLHNSAEQVLDLKQFENKNPELILLSNGTYKFDGIEGVGLEKNGTWKTGGIDGMFEFEVEHGTEWVSPSGSGDESALSFEYQMDEDDKANTKSVLFVKK